MCQQVQYKNRNFKKGQGRDALLFQIWRMKMKSIDVTALGELLIDFTENGMSSQGNQMFEANPGGAPCNVLAMLTKLGNNLERIVETFRRYTPLFE